MTVSDKLVTFVAGYEGYVAAPYWDVSRWAHGHGTACEEDSPPISRKEARQQLRHELNEVVPSIPRRERMKQQEVDALASLGYNLGTRVLVDEDFSTLALRLKGAEGREFEDRRDVYHDELRRWCSPGRSTKRACCADGWLRRGWLGKAIMGSAHYEIFKDAADQYRWRLVAGNGEPVAQSEAYTTKADAERGAKAAAGAALEASVSIEIETKEDSMPAYIWQLLAVLLIVVIVLVLVDAA